MSETGSLFRELPEQSAEGANEIAAAMPRLRQAQRDQTELQVIDLDSVLPSDHPARAVWAFVEHLDLSVLYDAIKARVGEPGHPPADPKILMTLWLYATVDGIGSARALTRLCEAHAAYRWICGGGPVNNHTPPGFRVGPPS